jgi:hypothetical protein
MVDVKFCPSCGAKTDGLSGKFCDMCGADLSGVKSPGVPAQNAGPSIQSAPSPSGMNKGYIIGGILIVIVIAIIIAFATGMFSPKVIPSSGLPGSNPVSAVNGVQTPSVSGSWNGQLTQGSNAVFDVTMDLTQNGKDIGGNFKIMDKDNHLYYGLFNITGSFEGNELNFQYTGVLDQKTKPGSGWLDDIRFNCVVNDPQPQKLTGNWASGYSRGKIDLKRS